jgi:hypothetical protein
LRRTIVAFPARRVSSGVGCFFGATGGVVAGVMGGDWAGFIDPCSTGCTLIGQSMFAARHMK